MKENTGEEKTKNKEYENANSKKEKNEEKKKV